MIIRDKVFISYSSKDVEFLDEFIEHLKSLERAGLVSKWSDRDIAPGSKYLDEIGIALMNAKVAVLLVSSSFLASDFIHQNELSPLLRRAEEGGVRVLWVPVRACSWEASPLRHYQAAISPSTPLAEMNAERDKAWVKVCKAIKEALTPNPP